MENLNLYGDNSIQISVSAVLSLKICITDKQFLHFRISEPAIETGNVKTGCQMSYQGDKHQKNQKQLLFGSADFPQIYP